MTTTRRKVIRRFVYSGLVGSLSCSLALFAQDDGRSKFVEISGPTFKDVKEGGIRIRNRVIDCSTNVAYQRGVYAHYSAMVGVRFGRNCQLCHRSFNPRPGQGDRPQTKGSSLVVQNETDKTQNYLIGEEGGDMQEREIAPGKMHNFTWLYDRPGANESPVYTMEMNGRKYKLAPLATPNLKLGNLYGIATATNGVLDLFPPQNEPHRKRR